MSTVLASTNIDNEPSPEIDFEPYVDYVDEPLPTPKELVKNGISLNLIGRGVGLGGLRFTPVPRVRKEGDGSGGDIERTVDGENDNKRESEWEDDAREGDEGEGKQELEIAVQMYATMTRPERKEMMDMLEANMKVMYVTLHLSDLPIYISMILPILLDIKKRVFKTKHPQSRYQESKGGWSRSNKTKEMAGKSTRMRFLLARPIPPSSSPTSQQPLAGFLAFTAIEEPKIYTRQSERVPVIYWYRLPNRNQLDRLVNTNCSG
ncbi:hypothetical protein L211DRAFT_223228 [Terfezia boudieri ATCC MYA-4762]|uniref:Uncharacterized protein n=1 Tax=Terfezia boudieri ATCC MYA-4762 TaxID=1051890 RepID=A0A3N4LLK7_9PEZI|nr:hypothetical protein L211DRAFT_223228 [Terfezia boudieri ATCC MYA-4762]